MELKKPTASMLHIAKWPCVSMERVTSKEVQTAKALRSGDCVLFCFVLRLLLVLDLLLECGDSLLQVFRGLFVLLFQLLQLLLNVTLLLSGGAGVQKSYHCDYDNNSCGIEGATHALILRSPRVAR